MIKNKPKLAIQKNTAYDKTDKTMLPLKYSKIQTDSSMNTN